MFAKKGVPNLPVKLNIMKERLGSCSSVLNLQEKDKIHVFELIKCIDNAKNGLTISRLKKEYLGRGKPLHFSNTCLIAYIDWLNRRNYITLERAKKLTKDGKAALVVLNDFLSPPKTNFEFFWNNDQQANRACFTGQLDDMTKTLIFSRDYFRNLIVELSAYLSAVPNTVDLTITVEPLKSRNVLGFLKFLWRFYYLIVTDSRVNVNVFAPLLIKTHLTDDESKQKYCDYWKTRLSNYLKCKGTIFEDVITFDGVAEKLPLPPLFPFIPQELEVMLPVFLKDAECLHLLETQIEKDPDWFMPHPVWVLLGFKQRREDISIDSISHVSPPYFHTINMQGLPEGFGNFESILRYVELKNDNEGIEAFCHWVMIEKNSDGSDFYRSWQILRQAFVESIHKNSALARIAPLLDEAWIKYISDGNKPVLNLKSVFSFYLTTKDTQKVLEKINQGLFLL